MSTVAKLDRSTHPRASLPAVSPAPNVDPLGATTVVRKSDATVVGFDKSTVVMSDLVADLKDEAMAGSARSQSARIANARPSLTTVDTSDHRAHLGEAHGPTFPYQRELNLWVTEDGDLVSQSRVRRIRIAQDVVNSAEEAVYDTLWNTKTTHSATESGRLGKNCASGL